MRWFIEFMTTMVGDWTLMTDKITAFLSSVSQTLEMRRVGGFKKKRN